MAGMWKKDDDWEEESELINPWRMTLIFLGLAVLAGIICTGIWYFTHLNKPRDDGQDSLAQVRATAEPASEPARNPSASSVPDEPEQDASLSPAPDSAQSPEPNPLQTSEPEPVYSASPEPVPKPVSGPASVPENDPKVTDAPIGTKEPDAQEPVSENKTMEFVEVHESVMAKDVVNLRSVPTTLDEENVEAQIKNGEAVVRIGINENTGWSKIEYNGETLYAVSQYLTTDLTYQPPAPPSDPNRITTAGGRVIVFTECDDWISPKEYVNLRTEPSTTEGESTVSCQLNYGEKAHRTGYSTDAGWSRVEYDGQVLYVVTSLMYEAAEE